MTVSLLTTKMVAVKTGLSADTIRWHERQGHLLAIKIERSPGVFMRLFVQEDVERFVQQRALARLAKAAAATGA